MDIYSRRWYGSGKGSVCKVIFDNVKSFTIPEGEVQSLSVNGEVLWERFTEDYREVYQRVKSITTNSTGGWFLTDFIANNNSGLEFTYSVPSFSDIATMGSRTSASDTRCYVFYPRTTTVGYFGWNTATSVSVTTKANTIYTTRLNWLNSRKSILLDEEGNSLFSKSISKTLVQQTSCVGIGRYNNATNTPTSKRVVSIFGARLSQGDEIVREYIPCYRKSDGEIGLFEIFTKTFVPSQVANGCTIGEEIGW